MSPIAAIGKREGGSKTDIKGSGSRLVGLFFHGRADGEHGSWLLRFVSKYDPQYPQSTLAHPLLATRCRGSMIAAAASLLALACFFIAKREASS